MAAYGLDRLVTYLENKGIKTNIYTVFIALVLVADLYSVHRNINPYWDSSFYQYYHPDLQPILEDTETFRIHLDPKITIPPSIQHTINNHHIRWQMMLSPNLGILHGLYHVGGVPALELRHQYLITEILGKPWIEKIHFLRLANVKYIISNHRLDKEPGLEGQIEKVNSLVYKIRDYLPRAWVVEQLKSIEKGIADELLDGSFDPKFSAFTDSDIISRYRKEYYGEVDKIQYEESGKICVKLTAYEPGILVLSESSYPGWQVFVDGKERECLCLNLLFQGVEIEKGYHEIEFVYRPKYFYFFLSITFCTLAMFLFLWTYTLLSERKKRLTSPNSTF
jgi:hypothetical protein